MLSKQIESFLKQDKYISRRELIRYLLDNNLEWNDELDNILKEHNDNYVNKKLIEEKRVFRQIISKC